MAAHDAGVQVTCPGCGQTVLQKAMIPVLGPEGLGVSYLCPTCARALVTAPAVAERDDSDPGGDATDTEPAARPKAQPAIEPATDTESVSEPAG